MEDNLHEVVKLLLARMKSHPEEFRRDHNNAGRWYDVMDVVRDYGTKEEDDAIDAGLRPIRLQEAHEAMMDELCNGDERRRREQEEQEYERDLMRRTQNMLLGHPQAINSGSYGKPLVSARHPTSSDMEENGIMNALRNIK